MAARMSIKELVELINVTKAAGNDASQFEQLLAEITPEKPVRNNHRISSRELALNGARPEEPVTSPEEMERLRTLACPHIRNSPFWEEFVSRRVLVCNSCKELRPGEFGEHRQPTLFN